MRNRKTLFITHSALLSAVALVLSYIEMSMPDMPFVLPGMKLGLSNIATMFALSAVNLPCALIVCLTKALFSLLMRGLTAFLMSLCGGVLSCLVMYIFMRLRAFGFIGIGVSGAFCHNLGQILIAFILTDSSVFAYLPVLCLASIITGSVTALALYIILPKILSIKLYKG